MSQPSPTRAALGPLVARDITVSLGGRRVLDGINLTASPGRPVGLIGENGSGKSTLLRVIADRAGRAGTIAGLDAGTVRAPDELGYLPQDVELPSTWSIGQVLTDALAPLHDAVEAVESLATDLADPTSQARYARALTYAEEHDAWDADRRAQMAAQRLGLSGLDRDTPVHLLSGGERSRLMLAALLVRRPPCLLLDEPTNHLDDDALDYLESLLRDLPGVVVAASHDRTFLDRTCPTLLDLDPSHFGTDGRGGSAFTGRFEDYLTAKQAARTRWEEEYVAQRDDLRHWRHVAAATDSHDVAHARAPRDRDKFIHHFKGENVQRTVRRRRRDAEQRVADIERHEIRKPPRPLELSARLTGETAGSVRVRGLDVPGRLRVDSFEVAAGEHVLVTGRNGSGKSTLLHVIAGRLQRWQGDVQVSARRIALLEQDVEFGDASLTGQQMYDAVGADVPLRDLGLVHPRDLARPVGDLSTGGRRRIGLAITIARAPDLLLLDEPTNHLSLSLASDLEDALGRSAGTVIVASHDRWLRRRWDGPTVHLA